MKKTIRGCTLLLCTTIIWGCAFVAQSVGMDYIGPFTFQAIRCFLGVLTLLPIILLFDLKKKDGQTFFPAGAFPRYGLPVDCAELPCSLPQVFNKSDLSIRTQEKPAS